MSDKADRDICVHSGRTLAVFSTATGGLLSVGVTYALVQEWAGMSWLHAMCGIGAVLLFFLFAAVGVYWLMTSLCATERGVEVRRLGERSKVLSADDLRRCTIYQYQPSTDGEHKPPEDGHLSFKLEPTSGWSVRLGGVSLSQGLPFLRELEHRGLKIVLEDSKARNFGDDIALYDYVDPEIKGVPPSAGR